LKKIDFKAIGEYFTQHPWLLATLQWSKNRSLPGFFKVPIYDVLVFLYHESRRYDLFTRASAVAFNYFLSLFPSLMAFFTLIPLFKRMLIQYLPEGENFDLYLRVEIERIMPGVAGDRLFDFIDDVTNNPRFGLFSFGFLLAIYFASNGMMSLMVGFEKSYKKTFRQRGELRKRLIAVFLTFLMAGLVMAAVILIILGEFLFGLLIDLTHLDQLTGFMIQLVRWLAVIFLFYSGIAVIYRYGAATIKRFKFFSPGASLATVLCILSSLGFSAYVNKFNTYNELYGSIGAIIVLMIWIQIISLILLIGFELNASIAINRDLKEERNEAEIDL
jgi:membrane protein